MTWELIETQELESAAPSISFMTGLTSYVFFRLTVYVVNDANNKQIYLRINGDNTNEYDHQRVTAVSTTIAGARTTSDSEIEIDGTRVLSADQHGSFVAIVTRAIASNPGQMISQAGLDAAPKLALVGAEWTPTGEAINQIDVVASANNFDVGTFAVLEGLAFA